MNRELRRHPVHPLLPFSPTSKKSVITSDDRKKLNPKSKHKSKNKKIG